MQKIKKKILKYSPAILLDVACTYEGYLRKRQRYGGDFKDYYQFYLGSAQWPESQLIDYQNTRLREVVKYSYANVAYYKQVFNESGISPDDIVTIDDLPKLPFLDKHKVRELGSELVSKEFNSDKLWTSNTGGSTGTPMKIYFSPETWPAQYGFFWARWRPGVTVDDRYASFQGQQLVASDRSKPPYWRTNYASSQRLYSIFHLKDSNLKEYVKNLNEFKPVYIQGYPSAMYIVADYMKRNDLKFSFRLKGAYSMSETIQDIHKSTVENVWNCPLWDQYGQGERVASITLRQCGNYHYDMDFGIIEFEKVSQCQDGEIAEVVGTSLINKAWTLLRYRTGDLVCLDRNKRCYCGWPGPVIKSIIGRTGDIITTPSGRKIMNITTAVKKVPGLVEFQIVQEDIDKVVANVVTSSEYDEASEKMIQTGLAERLGPDVNVMINYLDKIERTTGGKFKAIVIKD